MQECLRSDDELFHVALYDWLIDKGLKDRLLEVSMDIAHKHHARFPQILYRGRMNQTVQWRMRGWLECRPCFLGVSKKIGVAIFGGNLFSLRNLFFLLKNLEFCTA